MKKSVAAVGVLVALGAVWVGGAWYTGKTAEQQIHFQVDQANEKFAYLFKDSPAEIKIDNVKFNRSFFSSDLDYDVIVTSKDSENSYSAPFNGKVYHGPLPLNQVSAFNFSPAIFSADVGLVKNEKTENWFGKSGKNPLHALFAMSYAGQFKGTVNSEVDTTIEEGDISWNLATKFDVNQKGIGKIEQSLPYFKIAPPDSDEQDQNSRVSNLVVSLTDATANLDLQAGSPEWSKIYVGSYHSQIAKLQITGKKNGEDILLEADNLSVEGSGKLNDKFIDYAVRYKLDGLKANGDGANNFSLGELALNLEFNHLDAQSMNTITDEIGKLDPNAKAPIPKAAEEAFMVILSNQPQLKIEPLSLSNPGGKMAANLNIVLASSRFETLITGKLSKLLSAFNLNIDLDKEAMIYLTSMALQSSPQKLSKEEADQAAAEQVAEFVQQLKSEGMIVEEDKKVKFGLNLEEQGLNFNGRTLTDDEVRMALLGAAMMFGR